MLPPVGPPRVPGKAVCCPPVDELPDAPGGVGPLTVRAAPASVCPAVEVAACPVLAVACWSVLVAVPVGEPGPVAGAVDLGASETRVGDGDEELTVTDGDGETLAFTVVVELPVPEDVPDVPEPPEEVRDSVVETEGEGDVELGRDAEVVAETEGAETEPEIGCDVDGSEPGLGACADTERTSAPAAPAPQTPRAAAASASEILVPAAIIRDFSNIRPCPCGRPTRVALILLARALSVARSRGRAPRAPRRPHARARRPGGQPRRSPPS